MRVNFKIMTLILFTATEFQNPIPPIDLSHNTNLTTLTINCSYVEGERMRPRHHWLLPALQTISSKALRRLAVVLRLLEEYHESHLEALDWTGIDRTLAQITSSNRDMELIVISMRTTKTIGEWMEGAIADVRSRLPVLHSGQVPITVRCHIDPRGRDWPMFPVG